MNQNNYVFITLGTSDVQIKDLNLIKNHYPDEFKTLKEEINYPVEDDSMSEKKNLKSIKNRAYGEWLKKLFDKIPSDISDIITLPLIEPCLTFFEEKKIFIKEIFLIATDQPDAINGKENSFHKQDTCKVAEFLKEVYFPFYFGNKKLSLPEIKIISINNPPNNYDVIINELAEKMQNETKHIQVMNVDNVYIEFTGGTAQITLAMILNGIKYFRDKVIFLYKFESNIKKNDISKLNIGNYILKTYEHESLKRLVSRYDFDAIEENKYYSESIRNLAKCACHRMNFDFFNYKEEIDEHFEDIPENMGLDILRSDAFRLTQKEPDALFNELYWNTVVMWQRDECANFLGRVWRIMEASLQYSLLDIIECTWEEMIEVKDKKKSIFVKKFERWANGDNDFEEYLEKNKDNYKMNYIRKPISSNMPMLRASVDFLAEKQESTVNRLKNIVCLFTGFSVEKKVKYKEIAKWAKKLQPLADMRNNCIIAHGFEDVSKKKIIDALKDEGDILLIVKSLIESVGIRLSEQNPFDIFKKIIIEINERKLGETLNV